MTAVWPKKIQSLDRKQPCKNTLKHMNSNSSLLAFSLSLVGSFLWFFISSLSKALEGYLSKSSTSRLWWRSNRWEYSVVQVLSCHLKYLVLSNFWKKSTVLSRKTDSSPLIVSIQCIIWFIIKVILLLLYHIRKEGYRG